MYWKLATTFSQYTVNVFVVSIGECLESDPPRPIPSQTYHFAYWKLTITFSQYTRNIFTPRIGQSQESETTTLNTRNKFYNCVLEPTTSLTPPHPIHTQTFSLVYWRSLTRVTQYKHQKFLSRIGKSQESYTPDPIQKSSFLSVYWAPTTTCTQYQTH